MASYLGNNPDNIIKVRKANYRYVATAAQTAFSGTDSNSLTMAINTSDVEVFLNGVLLDQTDYTATTSTVTLSAGATVNDIVEVITNTDFQVSALYTKEEVDVKVATAITDLVGTAGSALNTLGELSDALNDDANYAATITTALGTKANQSTTYTKTEVDTALGNKSNTSTTVTKDSTTGAATLPIGTTAQRPASPTVGMVRYNTTIGYIEEYRNSQWVPLSNIFAASGGTITTATISSVNYQFHTFTSSGTFTVTSGSTAVDVLLVAAGGGGGTDPGGTGSGGGGGAGGVLYQTSASVSPGQYSIVIGAGGTSNQTAGGVATNGSNTTGLTYTAIGGGGGGNCNSGTGASGGSGGGGADDNGTGGAGTSGQGYAGGSVTGSTNNDSGGGGGGATAAGNNGAVGWGGEGRDLSAYFGTSFGESGFFGGGGGSGGDNGRNNGTKPSTSRTGGKGGGGDSALTYSSALNGWANTGGGGGCEGQDGSNNNSGTGGSGIVIVRYVI